MIINWNCFGWLPPNLVLLARLHARNHLVCCLLLNFDPGPSHIIQIIQGYIIHQVHYIYIIYIYIFMYTCSQCNQRTHTNASKCNVDITKKSKWKIHSGTSHGQYCTYRLEAEWSCIQLSGKIYHHFFRQWLVTCLAPSCHLDQSWFIVNWTPRNRFRWN